MRRAVQRTGELRRIAELPRRDWLVDIESLVDPLTKYLTLPNHVCNPKGCAVLNGVPVVRLRQPQAIVLAEAHDFWGAFMSGDVGVGKTLISMLLGPVLCADRILLIVPAELRSDTRDKFRVLREHWASLPMRIESYERISNDRENQILGPFFKDAQRPLLILDEADNAKDLKHAACAKKIHRFISDWRETGRTLFVVPMTGTPAKRSLRDFRHMMWWARPDACPLPLEESDLGDWCDAIDEKVPEKDRIEPGALLKLCSEEDYKGDDPIEAARRAVGRRMFETPGIVGTTDTGIDVPLHVNCVQVVLSKAEDDGFQYLRDKNITPDGHPIADAVALWRHARELALGFYYKWDPRPPNDWLYARSAWCAAVRDILAHNRRDLDTEFQVWDEVNRAINGRVCPACKRRSTAQKCRGVEHENEITGEVTYDHTETETTPAPKHHEAEGEFKDWEAIKDTFIPNTVPVWIGDTALRHARDWGAVHSGIIWTEHRAVAHRLAEFSGLPYYGAGGKDAKTGRPIEKADPKSSLIASIASNFRGRNLQAWCNSLVTSFPPTGTIVQQMLGRMHRPGQMAARVTYEVMIACREQLAGFEQAKRDSTFHKDVFLGHPKLSLAQIHVPIIQPTGWAWKEQAQVKKERPKLSDRLEQLRPTG